MGKKIQKIILTSRIAVVCALLGGVPLAGCNSELSDPLQSGRVLPLHGMRGRWVGPVVPTEPSCGSTTQGLMSIGGREFGFDPFQGTAVIRGAVEDDHLTGKLVRQGNDHQVVTLAFEATADDAGVIKGTLQSGRCRWSVELRRG